MSQHGRIISREKGSVLIKRNPNGRIHPVLTLFGVILGIMNAVELLDLKITSLFFLLILIMLHHIIDESFLHSEIKPVRHILLLLLLFVAIQTGLSLSNLSIFTPLFTCPILLAWGVLYNEIGGMFRRIPFLIRNENGMKATSVIYYVTGILFFITGLEEVGALVGLMRPIQLLEIYAQMAGCATGVITAFSCSYQFNVFKNILKIERKVKNGGI